MGTDPRTASETIAGSECSLSDGFLRDVARIEEAPPPAADPIGAQLGRFRVVALLGRGGMGVVYRAVDEALRRDVALKVLPPGFADDQERRRRFLREARSAAAVNHPCIATVHEVGEAEGRVYIAMELVPGKSLAAVLAERRLPVAEAVRIARRILDGLDKAHEAGLVHRDLKPDNVMITDDGAVKVLDFGLAKPQEQATSDSELGQAETITHVTTEGRVVGTPSYMSPEQARGVAVDRRSDVFSFGVMLYEMLTGQRPFTGKTAVDVTTAILRDDPAPVSKANPEVPAELSRIVERCLAKGAGWRYGDCRSLAEDLDGAVWGRAQTAAAGDERHQDPPARRWPRRSMVAAVIASVAIGAIGVIGGMSWRGVRSTAEAGPGRGEVAPIEGRVAVPPSPPSAPATAEKPPAASVPSAGVTDGGAPPLPAHLRSAGTLPSHSPPWGSAARAPSSPPPAASPSPFGTAVY